MHNIGNTRFPFKQFSFRHSLMLVFILALILRVSIATFSDLTSIDRRYLPDDTYYILTIARSLAAGLGPSVDGVHPTSGFQPLITFLLIPVSLLSSNPDVLLRFALLLLAVCDSVNCILLGILTSLWQNRRAGILSALMWAFSPVAILNALNGMETSLSLTSALLLMLTWLRARNGCGTRGWILAGVSAALAVLARVDNVFLIASLGVMELFRGNRRGCMIAALSGIISISPWWLYAYTAFGTIIPQSGAAVKTIVETHHNVMPLGALVCTTQIVFDTPCFDAANSFVLNVWFVWGVCVLFLIMLPTRPNPSDSSTLPLRAFQVHGVAIWAFYTFYLPAFWFFRRYLAPAELLWTMVCACHLSGVWDLPSAKWKQALSAMLLFGVLTMALFRIADFCVNPPKTPGYRELARLVLGSVSKGSVVGAFQSGALAYEAGKDWTVVNLDGVVNQDAAIALKTNTLGSCAKRAKVAYFADWQFNVDNFLKQSGGLTRNDLEEVASFPPIVVYRIRWPDKFEPTSAPAAHAQSIVPTTRFPPSESKSQLSKRGGSKSK